MREIHVEEISAAVERLCLRAVTVLSEDLKTCIRRAAESEPSPQGQAALGDIIQNFTLGEETGVPICQDTGMAIVFADLGQEVHIQGGLLEDAVNEGVRRGYVKGLLRKSVVRDPFRRENTGDNTPAVLHLRLTAGDRLRLVLAPKGFGSENMSAMKLLLPTATVEETEDFIVSVISQAGASPCPPVVVGVGLGGSIESCAQAAKRALLLPMDHWNPDPFYEKMERETLEKLNRLGIGPCGYGGRTTALKVSILPQPAHITSLPCVVNVSCHVNRHAEVTL